MQVDRRTWVEAQEGQEGQAQEAQEVQAQGGHQWVDSEAQMAVAAEAHLDLVVNRRRVDVMSVAVIVTVTATGIESAPGDHVRGTGIGNVDLTDLTDLTETGAEARAAPFDNIVLSYPDRFWFNLAA